MRELKWAVLGCGVIANEMAQALEHMGKTLYAVGTVRMKRQLLMQKNIMFPKYMMIFMKCLKIRK